jgi:hypothetical protein
VRKTIEREAHGEAVTALERKQANGRTVYVADIHRDQGKPLRLKVGEDGGIVWRDDLKERARADAEAHRDEPTPLPKPGEGEAKGADEAKDRADRHASGEPMKRREAGVPEGAPRDQAHAGGAIAGSSSGAQPSEMPTVKAGKEPPKGVLAIEQLPAPVQLSLLRQSDGREISDIKARKHEGRPAYEARLRGIDGKKRRILIAEDGTVISEK